MRQILLKAPGELVERQVSPLRLSSGEAIERASDEINPAGVRPERALVRLPGNGGAAASDQEIEIRTLVGLGHALDVQLLIPALHRRLRLPPL